MEPWKFRHPHRTGEEIDIQDVKYFASKLQKQDLNSGLSDSGTQGDLRNTLRVSLHPGHWG